MNTAVSLGGLIAALQEIEEKNQPVRLVIRDKGTNICSRINQIEVFQRAGEVELRAQQLLQEEDPMPKTSRYVQTVLMADQPTINGHVYPADVLEKAVAEYNAKDRKYGPVDPEICQVRLKDVAFKVEKLEMQGPKMVAHVDLLLETVAGRELKERLDGKKGV